MRGDGAVRFGDHFTKLDLDNRLFLILKELVEIDSRPAGVYKSPCVRVALFDMLATTPATLPGPRF